MRSFPSSGTILGVRSIGVRWRLLRWLPEPVTRLHWIVVSLGVAFASSSGVARDRLPSERWPTLQTGVWETECTRSLPNGKLQTWKENVSQCQDATELLRGYWGLGIVEEAGCRYVATQLVANKFKITSKCMVRHAGVAASEATVTAKSADEFEMHIKVVEGKKIYGGSAVGHWRSACPIKLGSK